MKRIQAVGFVAALVILVVLASAIGLARYRHAAVEPEGHEHHHGLTEHAPEITQQGAGMTRRQPPAGSARSAHGAGGAEQPAGVANPPILEPESGAAASAHKGGLRSEQTAPAGNHHHDQEDDHHHH